MLYKSKLDLLDTEIAIKYIKDEFERKLAEKLNLIRVSAPLFVFPETGLNDNLNGYERAVRFDVADIKRDVEIVQSLAKWKRMALKKYGFKAGSGLYTDMNAIRRDEVLDELHSVYVDQWDWEKIITESDRNTDFLKATVRSIYSAVKETQKAVNAKYPVLTRLLPEDITFVSTEEAEALYPSLTRKEREGKLAEKYGAIFLNKIGWDLKDGKPHDGRAADYDDWNLNGDIILWFDTLKIPFEISSMGIRVDKESLKKQLAKKGENAKLENPYCKGILADELPLTVGGGIGQSRLCMYFLEKAHIGEVQASVWSEKCIEENLAKGIKLL